MRNTLLLAASIGLTILCWGTYGPVVQWGQQGMSLVPGQVARLRPFVCVGVAYFLIGVIVPSLWLHFRGEKGEWTFTGIIWSLAGGALGAVGALGIVLAFTFGGKPVYVMPLVFGGAPVVNAFLTVYLAGKLKEIGPWFLAGLIMVAHGAVTVLLAAPHGPPKPAVAASVSDAGTTTAETPPNAPANGLSWLPRVLAIALTVVCWGAYGPVLHKGQAAMHHSRMRPLLCVGLAYFLIAVIVPYFFLGEMGEASTYKSWGTMWALLGGTVGALGAIGIIMAFNWGGKPIFVMPLVFGGAPVINTLFAIRANHGLGDYAPLFLAGLILVVAGAALVLVMAPRGDGAKALPAAKEDQISVPRSNGFSH